MSFTPLPKTFTDFFAALESPFPRVLELGCGDGRFGQVLDGYRIPRWGLDRLGPAVGTVADIVGDALTPPVAPATLDLLLVPNLLRHILQGRGDLQFLVRWVSLLKPGGALFIFEDEPAEEPAGAARYRDLQEFLRRLMPESRGTLMALDDFRSLGIESLPGITWSFGRERNREPIDVGIVMELLGQGGKPDGEPGRLMAAIDRDGLDPGDYWWARAVPAAKEVKN